MNWIKASERLPSKIGELKLKIDGKEAYYGKYEKEDDEYRNGDDVFRFKAPNGSGSLHDENFGMIEWLEE